LAAIGLVKQRLAGAWVVKATFKMCFVYPYFKSRVESDSGAYSCVINTKIAL
jgi:hypothetical protein